MGLRLGLFLWIIVLIYPWVLPIRYGRWGRAAVVLGCQLAGVMAALPFIQTSLPAALIASGLGWVAAWYVAFTGGYSNA